MRQDLRELYRGAIGRMTVSKDERIEQLRRAKIVSTGANEPVSPQIIAQIERANDEWAETAFEDLYASGFIVASWPGYFWFAPNAGGLSDRSSVLAGMEAVAIIRLSYMNCAPALPGIRKRLKDLLKAAESGDAILTSLARQRLMLNIVGSIGSQRLAEDYLKSAKPAMAYATAAQLDERSLAGICKSAERVVDGLGGSEPRTCVAEAVAMRLHPAEPVRA